MSGAKGSFTVELQTLIFTHATPAVIGDVNEAKGYYEFEVVAWRQR